jgi:3-hexulose-6-phosphate synthase
LKLQVAFDRMQLTDILRLAEELADIADIIEIGTSVIKADGMKSVAAVRKRLPETTLLADIKAVDGVEYELKSAFDAGADIATVMAWADDGALTSAIAVEHQYQKLVVVDLLNMLDPKRRVKQLIALGVRAVCVHASQTQERYGSFDTLRDVYDISTSCNKADLQVAISGKITVDKIDQVAQTPPDVVVVGSAITKACHPVAAAREFKWTMARVTR